jgi:hypothetical protein
VDIWIAHDERIVRESRISACIRNDHSFVVQDDVAAWTEILIADFTGTERLAERNRAPEPSLWPHESLPEVNFDEESLARMGGLVVAPFPDSILPSDGASVPSLASRQRK